MPHRLLAPQGCAFQPSRSPPPRRLAKLLKTEDAMRTLLTFVNATGRLRQVFGALPDISEEED